MGAYGLHSKRINEHTTSNALELDIPYFKSKFLGELEVDEAIAKGLDSVIVNPSNVAGPGDTKNMPATYIRLVYSGILPFIGRGIHSFCHVREVVRAMITCLERGRTGERYLLGGADTDFLTMGRCIEKIIDGRAPRTTVPAWVFRLTANVISRYAGLRGGHTFLTPELARLLSSNMLVDSGKAIRELDYKPVPLEEMIADSAQWLKEHGYLIPYSGWTWR